MTTLLLDADVVIALTVADHNHERASRWFVTVEQAAVCPVVEGALIRFLVRVGVSATTARALLAALHTATRACSSGPTRFRTQTSMSATSSATARSPTPTWPVWR